MARGDKRKRSKSPSSGGAHTSSSGTSKSRSRSRGSRKSRNLRSSSHSRRSRRLVTPASTHRTPEHQAESQQVYSELLEDRIRNLEQNESRIADTSEGLSALRSYFDIKLLSLEQTVHKVSKKLKLSNVELRFKGNRKQYEFNPEQRQITGSQRPCAK